ncbi:MAG: hypothetical protein IJJ25_06500 [Lachnospiraceae bacterium]|nr:hypothetical protein [Lachnospiraceae bacterium]
MNEKKLICHKCREPLCLSDVSFFYMGHKLKHPIPSCPVCGQVYISPELAAGKIREVEKEMEDK